MKTPKDPKSEPSELKDLKNLAAILSQLYITNQVRGGDKPEFLLHENVKHPSSISKDGELYHRSKSNLIQELIDTLEESLVADHSSVDAAVTDGPAIVHMVQPKNNCTVDKYCNIHEVWH